MSFLLAGFGAFRSSFPASGGLVHKIPWKLNHSRKANVRDRLAMIEKTVAAVRSVHPELHALKNMAPLPKTPREKYFVEVRMTPSNPSGLKGLHKIPHFTKLPRNHESRILSWSKTK
ncbi:hypothetical protein H696_03815 [Fonticula alba]|uniref:54S ribosomal protein L31, mitochondrial n=1 Tax=Fonticula alba TaxID=691883 RepID=A0A058Z529_FONAL|nr:hypothetical protein H696_03815 [Fonticula alba]KCV69384.1 hypothetical protein H696_03815 [Fonticula alba]|eukprot:XP_009495949.1 hypothetical protein H696_03815 [Fonticula alba]